MVGPRIASARDLSIKAIDLVLGLQVHLESRRLQAIGVVSAVLLCFEFGINNNFAQIPAWIFENHHIFTVLTTCVISV